MDKTSNTEFIPQYRVSLNLTMNLHQIEMITISQATLSHTHTELTGTISNLHAQNPIMILSTASPKCPSVYVRRHKEANITARILFLQVTNYTEQSLYLDTESPSASQEVPILLCSSLVLTTISHRAR
jgi:hypothetical protein